MPLLQAANDMWWQLLLFRGWDESATATAAEIFYVSSIMMYFCTSARPHISGEIDGVEPNWTRRSSIHYHSYCAPDRRAEYCDDRVCLSVRDHISGTTDPIFTEFFMHVTHDRGSVLLWRRDDMLGKKGKVFPYSLPSVGPGPDPGVQAVSPQVTWSESRHRPGSRLPLLSAGPAVTSVAFTRWRYL